MNKNKRIEYSKTVGNRKNSATEIKFSLIYLNIILEEMGDS